MSNRAELKKYGIDFRVDDAFVQDFFALKEAWERGQKHLDCERSAIDGDLRCLANADWISIDNVRYVEDNFIYSDVGFFKAHKSALAQYGIHFRVDDPLIEDFCLLKDGWERKSSRLDCFQDQALSDIHALERCRWITHADVEFFEENFIYSDKGFLARKK